MAQEPFDHLRGVGELAAASRALAMGDLAAAESLCSGMQPPLSDSPPVRKLLATTAFYAGRA